MDFSRFHISTRHPAAVLALSSIVLLGCARKVQIEIPDSYHGAVHITCTGLSDDRSISLHVDATGQAITATCPERQTDTIVVRTGAASPVEANILWTTTGDGIVREISFDVSLAPQLTTGFQNATIMPPAITSTPPTIVGRFGTVLKKTKFVI